MFRIEIKSDCEDIINKIIYTEEERFNLNNICSIDFEEKIIYPDANIENIHFKFNKTYKLFHDVIIGEVVEIKINKLPDKEKLGRPKKNKTPMDINLKVRITEKELEKIEKYKNKHNMLYRTDVIRFALKKLLDE